MNVTELIQRVRDIVKEQPQQASSPRLWPDDEILRALNSAYASLWNAARGADEQWGLDYKMLSDFGPTLTRITDNIGEVLLDKELGDVLYMEDETSLSNEGGAREVVQSPLKRMRRGLASAFGGWTTPLRWTLGAANNIIYLTNPDDVDLTQVRVWFNRHVPRLVRFTPSSFPTTTSLRVSLVSGATLGVLENVDDAYRNVWVQCVTVTAAGPPQGRRFFARGWAAGTHPNFDLTLDRAHGSPAGSSWETLPLFPPSHHETIAQLAALRLIQGVGDQALAAAIAQTVGALNDEFVKLIEQRQVQSPRYVNYEG